MSERQRRQARHASGQAICTMAVAADDYARAYRAMFDSPIGDDGVLGPAFTQVLSGLLSLLNGELGTHDGGTLDRHIRRIAADNAIGEDDL